MIPGGPEKKKKKDQVKGAAEKRWGRKKTGPRSLIPVTIKTPTPVVPIVYIQQPKNTPLSLEVAQAVCLATKSPDCQGQMTGSEGS